MASGRRSPSQLVADQLREEILAGERGRQRLPTADELAARFSVAKGTVRQAAKQLQAEGLIEVVWGSGMYTRDLPPVRRMAGDRFRREHRLAGRAAYLVEAESEGWEPKVEVLEVGQVEAPDEIAVRLGLAAGRQVLVRRRRYLAGSWPMELATSYVPWKLAKGTAMTKENPGPGGIYARLEEAGHRLEHFVEEVTSRAPTDDEVDQLRLREGAPVLIVVRTAVDSDGQAVEVCDTVMASDRYVLSYRLPAD